MEMQIDLVEREIHLHGVLRLQVHFPLRPGDLNIAGLLTTGGTATNPAVAASKYE